MKTFRSLMVFLLCAMPGLTAAQAMQEVLGAGDTVRISAFRYPDLTT
jgi:hypothetical protein